MINYTESELIEGVKSGDKVVILFIMRHYADNIKKMINDLKIERHIQPEDVIQEGMVELIINIRGGKFRMDSSVSTYYYSICRFICLKHYNRFKNIHSVDEDSIKDNELIDKEADDRLDLVLKILKEMKKECIEIIDLRFGLSGEGRFFEGPGENRGFEEIAKYLKIEYANARQRFSRCMQALLAEYKKRKAKLLN